MEIASMKNLDLWNKVCETDPGNTKEVTFGRKFTAIDAYSQIKMATEQFGQYGVGWGIRNIRHTFVPNSTMVLAVGKFFIPDGESIVSSSIFYISEKGKPDDDFAKKLETDMITKALSRLGFNADVFLGMFDDNRYVQKMKEKILEKEPITKEQVKEIEKLIKDSQSNDLEFLKYYKISKVENMSVKAYPQAIAILNRKIKEKK